MWVIVRCRGLWYVQANITSDQPDAVVGPFWSEASARRFADLYPASWFA